MTQESTQRWHLTAATLGPRAWMMIWCLAFLFHTFPLQAKAGDSYTELVAPFLQSHCVDCHGPEAQEAQLRYDRFDGYRVADRNLWTLVYEQLASGTMPPEGEPRPDAETTKKILAWIEAQQRASRAGGTRRLNRRELSAALRDVTGLQIDFAAALPDDGRVDGFDTGADGLQDAADSVAQIMEVTRRAVDGLRFLEPASKQVYLVETRNAKDGNAAFVAWNNAGISVSAGDTVGRPGLGLLLKPKWLGDRGGLSFRVPPPSSGRLGVLRLKAVVSAQKFVDEIPNSNLWVEVGGRDIDHVEITGTEDEPQTLIYDVHLADVPIGSKGLEITLTNRVEVPYSVEGFPNDDRSKPGEEIPGGTGLFRPQVDQKSVPLERQPLPFVLLHSLEVNPDYRVAWPPADWNADFADGDFEDTPECAKRLLSLWMQRAWRRPVAGAEQERFFKLYAQLRREQNSFDSALRAAFQAVLLSGSFRYLPSPEGQNEEQSQFAFASRLSFALWGTPPDDELRKLAAVGRLRDPKTLDAQVDRLIADLRSDAFVRPFVIQWLEMDQPITVTMDYLQKQDYRFGRNLKASMQEETISYVAEMLRENRPAREMIDSDWTMMNDILAWHYGYKGVEGGTLRRVTLRGDDPRGGGILSHAGIQSMLCWMGENWVIYRGAWMLRHILDDPPPPPPLEVPELIPSDASNKGKSFRELLVQHQEDAKCSVCHKSMDPLGFAFQNFDLSGRWRNVEFERYVRNELDGKIEWRGSGKTRPVDAEGSLPRGEKFTSFVECKELIVKNYQADLVRGLMKNFVIYTTGRKADVADLAEIREIMGLQAARGYPLRELLKATIRSQAFVGTN